MGKEIVVGRRATLLLAVAVGALISSVGVALAAAGDLDRNFGGDGKVITAFRGGDASAEAVAVQPDGKILAAGIHQHSGGYDFALARYNRDGTLDRGFGDDGRVTTDFDGFGRANALAIQPDGKILAAGHGVDSSFGDFAVARFNPNGSLDESFGGGDGKVTTNFGGRTYEEIYGLVLLPEGKLVAAGSTSKVSDFRLFHNDIALVRYNANGKLDKTFGDGDGKVTTDVGPGNDEAYALVPQPDGKLVAAGLSAKTPGRFEPARFLLVRYETDGTQDETFGEGGIVTTAFGQDSGAFGLVQRPEGRLVAAGFADQRGSVEKFALAGYETDGDLDPSFGNGDGKVTTLMGSSGGFAWDLARQPNGRLVAAGSSFGFRADGFGLARYRPSGALDDSFGGDGRVFTNFQNSFDSASSVVVQQSGKLVAAGSSEFCDFDGSEECRESFALARYLGD